MSYTATEGVPRQDIISMMGTPRVKGERSILKEAENSLRETFSEPCLKQRYDSRVGHSFLSRTWLTQFQLIRQLSQQVQLAEKAGPNSWEINFLAILHRLSIRVVTHM